MAWFCRRRSSIIISDGEADSGFAAVTTLDRLGLRMTVSDQGVSSDGRPFFDLSIYNARNVVLPLVTVNRIDLHPPTGKNAIVPSLNVPALLRSIGAGRSQTIHVPINITPTLQHLESNIQVEVQDLAAGLSISTFR